MKATMQIGDRVHVEPVGVNTEILSIVPLWQFGKEEPAHIYYDCGLGRLFEERELLPIYPESKVGQTFD